MDVIQERALISDEHSVETAENGQLAVSRLLTNDVTNNFDVVIMDDNMPVMTGTEALTIVRQERNNIPVIILTGDTMAEKKEQLYALGASRSRKTSRSQRSRW